MDGAGTYEPRVVSARDTFFAKFVLAPVFLIGGVVLVWGTLVAFAAHEFWKSVGYLAAIVTYPRTIWPLTSLKRVALSPKSLHVSNFLKQIEVPLGDVSNVGEIEGLAYSVFIEFKRDTPFGRQIRFSPPGLYPPRPHPVVAELRAAVAAFTSQAPLRRPW